MNQPKPTNWDDGWVLAGDRVSCPECHAKQCMDEADYSFVHHDGCSRKGAGQKPCREMLEMVKQPVGFLPEENV